MIDLLCLGRAAVDFYADQIGSSLEEAATFSKYVGGCPANIAIGTSRLGLKSGVICGVGSEAMGRFVKNTLIQEGVDVSCLIEKEARLTALVLLGIIPPDHFPLIFYRENCADMAITVEDLIEERIKNSRALLITGTHCSNPSVFEATKKAVAINPSNVILDIDYRPVLWGAVGHAEGEERKAASASFAERMDEVLPFCKLIVGTEEEISAAVHEEDFEKALTSLRKKTTAAIVRKRGEKGCIVYPENGGPVEGKAVPVPVMNVLGAGDAFMSGFLRGYLRDESWETAASWGNVCGALVVSRHGCSPEMPYWEELQTFLKHPGQFVAIDALHYRLGRGPSPKRLTLFAFDHRTYFKDCDPKTVRQFKELAYQAFLELDEPDTGIISDPSLSDVSEGIPHFVCIEEPDQTPLTFLEGREAAEILQSWPVKRGVKVLAKADEKNLPQLSRLAKACRKPRRELLIELVDKDLKTIAAMIEACYEKGISPEWWKLPPHLDEKSWTKIDRVIADNDPNCRGVLLLGQEFPVDELSARRGQIEAAAPLIKGCAVGRSIWGGAFSFFVEKKGSDRQVIEMIIKEMRMLIGETVWQK